MDTSVKDDDYKWYLSYRKHTNSIMTLRLMHHIF